MKLRHVQFVYLVVLLSSLRMAGASILPAAEFGMDGRTLGSVLCRDCGGVWTEITLVDTGLDWSSGSGAIVVIGRFSGDGHGLLPQTGRSFGVLHDPSTFDLPAASLAAHNTAWTVKASRSPVHDDPHDHRGRKRNTFVSGFELKAAAPGKVDPECQSIEQQPASSHWEFKGPASPTEPIPSGSSDPPAHAIRVN